MKYLIVNRVFSYCLVCASLLLFSSMKKEPENSARGLFDGSGDIGDCKIKGSVNYNPATGTYTLTGSGTNMWQDIDEFFMVWKKVTGNFSLSAKVTFEGKGVNEHRKMGLIIRESLAADAKYADVAVHGDGLTSLQYREKKGDVTKEVTAPHTAPDHILLERKGNKIFMKTAKGKFPQEITAEIEISLPETCYIGLFVCSHEADVAETAHFSDVQYKKR